MKYSLLSLIILFFTATASGQWLDRPDPTTPRMADGKPNLSAPAPKKADGRPSLAGIWVRVPLDLPPRPFGTPNTLSDRLVDGSSIAMQPWAEALFKERSEKNLGGGRPSERCLPHGIPDAMLPGALFKFIETPGVTLLLYEEFNHYRQIFTDGRPFPDDPQPTWFGYSVGRWEGDTFVVETRGFNDQTWLDDSGHPHTEAMHTTERFRRKDFGHMDLIVMIDDAKAYAKPWSVSIPLQLLPDTELIEDVCDNERDSAHISK
jgi:hypothetical protein